jgi:hypothetical protein
MECTRCRCNLVEEEWLGSPETGNLCLSCWNNTHCNSCGTYVKDDWNFCPMCGANAKHFRDKDELRKFEREKAIIYIEESAKRA